MSSETQASPAKSEKPILLLAFANASQNPLKIHQEKIALVKALVRELKEKELEEGDIKNEYTTDLCEVVILSEASINSIIDAFEEKKYKDKSGNSRIAVFHYAGHAGDDALLLESKQGGGNTRRAYSEGLISLFKEQTQQGMLKFVFLNGCSSQKITDGFLRVGVPAVLGTTKSIQDSMAIDLSERFYKGLGNGNSLLRSWNMAEAQIRSYFKEDISSTYRPVIFNRENQLPDQFPWQIRFGKGADHQGLKGWNLPEASKNPLHNLPLPDKYYNKLPASPYTGLNYFREDDAAIFFGRGAEIRNLHNTIMEDNRVILLHGKSGVGKSSLLFAGLIPRIKLYYPIYFRRNQEKGLLQSLLDAITEQLPDKVEKITKVSEIDEYRDDIAAAYDQFSSISEAFNTGDKEEDNGSEFEGFLSAFAMIADNMKEGLTAAKEWGIAQKVGQEILANWGLLEKITQKPVLLIIDQVEEIFTRPKAGSSNFIADSELDIFLFAINYFLSLEEEGIKGKTVFAFRKEYFSDIREIFTDKNIPFVDFHLKTLEKDGIVGAIKGVQNNSSLKSFYKIEFEEDLPEKIAHDILADSDASVAPMLQIIMRKLWDEYAAHPAPSSRNLLIIKDGFYQSGISTTMEDFFQSQVEIFKNKGFADLVENGWLYEVLYLHTTRLGTATSYQSRLLEKLFDQDHDRIVEALIELKQCFLIVGLEVQSNSNHVTLLAHDTLAPIVRRANEESDYPGQRARRILYGKMRNIRYWFPREKVREVKALEKLKETFFEKHKNYDFLRENIRKTLIGSELEFNDFWDNVIEHLESDFEEKLPQIYLSEYEIETIKVGEHGMRQRTRWENRLLQESERIIEEHKQEVQKAIGQSKYNLALAFEVQATRMIEEIESHNNLNSAVYEKAWLYGLHALNQEFPKEKSLPTTLSRITSTNLASGPFRRLWKSPAFLNDHRLWLEKFSSDCSFLSFKENSEGGFYYGKIDVMNGKINRFLEPEDMGNWKWSAQKTSFSLDMTQMAFLRIESEHRIQLVFMDVNTKEYQETFSIEIMNEYNRHWLRRYLFIHHHPQLKLAVFGTPRELFIKKLNEAPLAVPLVDEMENVFEIEQLVFSGDGKNLILLDTNGKLYWYRLWNEESQQIEYESIKYPPQPLFLDIQEEILIEGVKGSQISAYKIQEVVVSNTGKYVAVRISDPNSSSVDILKLFSMEYSMSGGIKLEDFGGILELAFSPDERFLAYRVENEGELDRVNVFNLQDGFPKLLVQIECKSEDGYIDKLGFHEDSRRLFTFSSTGELNIWRVDDGGEFNVFEMGEAPSAMAMTNDFSTLYTATYEGVKIWDFHKKKHIGSLILTEEAYKGSYISAFEASQNGIIAAIFSSPILGSLSNSIGSESSALLRVWETDVKEEKKPFKVALPEDSVHMALHKNGELLAADWKGSNVRIWHLPTRKWMNLDGPGGKKLLGLDFDSESQRLAASFDNGQIFIWNIPDVPERGRWKKVRKRRKIDFQPGQIKNFFFEGENLGVLTLEQLIVMDLSSETQELFPYKSNESSGMYLCKNKRFLIFSTCFDDIPEIIFYDLVDQRILTKIELEGTPNRALNFYIDPQEKILLTSDVEQSYITIFDLEFMLDYLTHGRESKLFEKIYKHSFDHLPYEFENIELREISIEGRNDTQAVFQNMLPLDMNPREYICRPIEE